jgi:hypothetical protein
MTPRSYESPALVQARSWKLKQEGSASASSQCETCSDVPRVCRKRNHRLELLPLRCIVQSQIPQFQASFVTEINIDRPRFGASSYPWRRRTWRPRKCGCSWYLPKSHHAVFQGRISERWKKLGNKFLKTMPEAVERHRPVKQDENHSYNHSMQLRMGKRQRSRCPLDFSN